MISIYEKNPLTGVKRPIKYAFGVGYLKRSNNLFTGKFSLPATDKMANQLHSYSFIEIYDNRERVELFVITKTSESFSDDVPIIQYELMDALFLLNLSIIEFLQLVNPTTKEALQAVLDCQYVPYWTLGECEINRGFSYSWENQNGLLDPLMSVLGDTGESYVIERDTTSFPFKINFRKPTTKISARVKQGYNMTGFTIENDGKNLVNWILPKGNAEGINAVDIKKVNGGKAYLMDQKSMDKYFPAQTIYKDERFTDDKNLLAAAKSRLDTWKEPEISWDVSAVDLSKVMRHPSNLAINQNREIKANELELDSLVDVHTKKYGHITLRVQEFGKTDSVTKPGELNLKITNENVNAFAYDAKRQQAISQMTANGAQNIIPFIFDREADKENPINFSFEIPEDVVNVNSCFLWLKTTNFRATSKANKSSPQTVSSATSSAGGATVQTATTEAAGNTTQSATSSAGGGQTSSAGGDHTHVMFKWVQREDDITGYQKGTFSTFDENVFAGMYTSGTGKDLITASTSGNHSHTVANHTHNVSISVPSHTHNVSMSIPAHTHNVSITIPGHTHEILYGIFKYKNLPSKLEIKIDDNSVPVTDVNVERVDILPHLKKDSNGKITRGKHVLEVTPNDLARIEVQLMLTIFIKSRIGGKN